MASPVDVAFTIRLSLKYTTELIVAVCDVLSLRLAQSEEVTEEVVT